MMKKNSKLSKIFVSLILCIFMVMAVVSITGITAHAIDDVEMSEVNTLGQSTNKAIMLGTNGISAWTEENGFDYIYYGVNSSNPVKWSVITKGIDGDLFLLAENVYDRMEFNEEKSSIYNNSIVKTWCSYFFNNAFSTSEKSQIKSTTSTDGILSGDKVFLMSLDEISTITSPQALFFSDGFSMYDWWLRTPGTLTNSVACVYWDGYIDTNGVEPRNKMVARPAFHLDSEGVLFTSKATGGKAIGTLGQLSAVNTYSGKDRKATIADDAHKNFSVSQAVMTGKSLEIDFTGACTGTNEYVSVIIVDSNNTVLYYGQIANNSASGNATLTVPNEFDENNQTIYVFAEQLNGDNKTDYASGLKKIEYSVGKPHNHCICGKENCPDSATHGGAIDFIPISGNVDGSKLPAGQYYLKDDVTLTSNIFNRDGDYTFCLNGHKLNADMQLEFASVILTRDLTICDCSENHGGEFNVKYSGTDSSAISIEGDFNLYSGTINLENSGYETYSGIVTWYNSSINILGGTVNVKIEHCGPSTYCLRSSGDITISGEDTSVNTDGAEIHAKNTLTISAGTITVKNGSIYARSIDLSSYTNHEVKQGEDESHAVIVDTSTNKWWENSSYFYTKIKKGAPDLTGVSANNVEETYNGTAYGIIVDLNGDASNATVSYGLNEGTYDRNTSPIFKDAGTYTIYYKVTKTGFSDYKGSATVKINSKDITVTADDKTKTYGDTDEALTYKANGLVGSDILTGITITRVTGENAGKYDIKLTMSTGANPNYNVKFVKGTYTITAKAITVTADDKTKIYGDNDETLTYKANGLVEGDTLKGIVIGRTSGEDVGIYNINLVQTTGANPNYNITFVKGKYTITPKAVTVTANDFTKVYGDDDEELSYTHGIILESDLLNLSVTRVAGENVGKYDIIVSQVEGANKNYNITFVKGTYTITPKAITVTADNKTKVYGDKDQELTYTAYGLVGSDKLTGITVTRETGENIGKYDIKATMLFGANLNYSISFVKGIYTITPKAITVTADNKIKTYGDKDQELTYTANGLVGSDKLTGITATRDNGENVGKYDIKLSMLFGANPNYSITLKNATFTVEAKAVTVTADNKTKTYGDKDQELTYRVSGLVGSDILTGITITRVTGENAGKYDIKLTMSTGANPNYNVKFVKGTYTITTKAITVIANDSSKTYGDKDQKLTYVVSGLLGSDELTGITVTRETGENVGKYDINLSMLLGANLNYSITFVKGTYTITPKAITVTADSLSKTYGDKDQELTYKANGLVGSDTLTGITVTRDNGENVGKYNTKATMLLGANLNYSITFVKGTYTITPKAITVTVDSLSKTYGDKDQELTYTANGLVGSDILTGITVTRDNGENVGRYNTKATMLLGANLNYSITFVKGTYTITPKAITVTADDFTKTYGDTDQELTYKANGLVGSDTLTGITVTRDNGENVGRYDIKLSMLFGANLNYSITFVKGMYTITPKAITVTVDDLSKTYGDKDQELTYKANGLVGFDVLTGITVTRDNGENVGKYDTKATMLLGANLNYSITFVKGTYAITPKAITVTVDNKTKTYGDKDQELTYKANGLVGSDNLTGITLARDTGENVGNYEIKATMLLGANLNYSINFVKGTYTITKATAVIDVDTKPIVKTYGDTWTLPVAKTNFGTVIIDKTVQDMINVNSYIVSYKVEGTNNYYGTTVTINVTINKQKVEKPTADNTSFVYNGKEQIYVLKADNRYSVSGVNGKDAGNYTATVVLLDKQNYEWVDNTTKNLTFNWNIAKADVTVKAVDKSKTYGDKDVELTYEADGLKENDKLDVTLVRNAGENAGTYKIKVSAKGANYNITLEEGTFTINPKNIDNLTVEVELGDALIDNGTEQTQSVKKVIVDGVEVEFDITGNTATTAGIHTMKITVKGNYAGSIDQKYIVLEKERKTDDFIENKTDDDKKSDIKVDDGNIVVEVKNDDGSIDAKLVSEGKDLMDVLDANELAKVANGDTANIWVDVKDANETVSTVSKKQIENKLEENGKLNLGAYIDISLFKKMASESEATQIHDLNKLIKVSILVPEYLQKTARTFCIVRNHDGVVDIIDGEFDEETHTFTFETDKFSDYGIAYEDHCVICKNRAPFLGLCLLSWMIIVVVVAAGATTAVIILKKKKNTIKE